MIHCLLGAIGIIDHKSISQVVEFTLYLRQGLSCFDRDHYLIGSVAVDDFSDKVVWRGIAWRLQDGEIDVSEIVEPFGEGRLFGEWRL